MIGSSLILVGPKRLQPASASTTRPRARMRAALLERTARAFKITKIPVPSRAPNGQADYSVKRSKLWRKHLADGAQVRPDRKAIGHVVERVEGERQILG